jgi:iron complex outermembrane receptor protein
MRKKSMGVAFKGKLLAGVAFAVLAGAVPVSAQDTTVLNPVVVEGAEGAASGTGPVGGYVAKATTTGSKTDTPLNEVPQSVSVVGVEEFNDRGIVNKVDEILRYTPGVMTQPYGVDPDTDWFYIRGFNATQTGVFLDSLSLLSTSYGGFQIDPYMLERVEVLKGPASVLYGGANPGGIVNMVMKRPLDEPLYQTEIGINSNGNAFAGFDISDKLGSSETMRYRVTGKLSGGDNYSDFSKDFRGFILPQITIEPDDATSFSAYAYLGALDQVHTGNGFFPYVGTVVNAPFGRIGRDFFPGEPDVDEGTYVQQMVGTEFSHELDNGIKLSQSMRYGHLYKHEFGPFAFGYVNTTDPLNPNYYHLSRWGFEHLTKVDTFTTDNRAEGEFELGGASHKMLVGVDYRYYGLEDGVAYGGSNPIDPTNPIYGVPQPALTVPKVETTLQQIGIYAQDQIRFGDGWLVTLNGRYDYVDTESQNWGYHSNDSALSGRAGLAYEFENGLTPYVSAATFFNPLIGTATSGPLVPEEGYQFEGGVKYEPTFVDGVFTASVFQITKDNYSVTDGIVTRQLGQVQSTGFELEGKVNINENWKVLASASYTDLEITKNPLDASLVGKTPYIAPDVTASLWLDYTVTDGALEGLSLGSGLRYKGKSWADDANTLRVPGAVVADAAIRYEKQDWVASLNVTNLFDKNYVESCGTALFCGYGEARTFTLKLSRKW